MTPRQQMAELSARICGYQTAAEHTRATRKAKRRRPAARPVPSPYSGA